MSLFYFINSRRRQLLRHSDSEPVRLCLKFVKAPDTCLQGVPPLLTGVGSGLSMSSEPVLMGQGVGSGSRSSPGGSKPSVMCGKHFRESETGHEVRCDQTNLSVSPRNPTTHVGPAQGPSTPPCRRTGPGTVSR